MYLFIDTETTGINKAVDRVVQIAWILTDKFGQVKQKTEFIIQPDGFYIPQRATNIHGITTELAKKNGVKLNEVLHELSQVSQNANFVIAHNIQFDLNFLRREFEEVQTKYPFDLHKQICTMQSAVTHCRLAKLNGMPGYKRPTLQELHFHLFRKYFDKAHDAMADTQACMKCFFELKKLGVFPNSIEFPDLKSYSENKKNTTYEIKEIFSNPKKLQNNNDSSADIIAKDDVLNSLQLELALANEKILDLESEIEFYNSDQCLFIQVAISGDIEWRKALARHPRTPEKLLIELCESLEDDYEEELAICLISNISLPSGYIKFLIDEIDTELITYAATNSSCSPKLLAEIIWSSDFSLLQKVQNNPSYQPIALETLLQEKTGDEHYEIRSWVAEFTGCPQYLLKALSFDADIDVRANVAKNSNCSSEILVRLADDQDEYVRDSALKNENHPINKTKALLNKSLNEILKAIEINDLEKLKLLAIHENPEISLQLAKNIKCPKSVLGILARNSNDDIRQAVAKHHNCHIETFEALSNDSNGYVRLAIAENPSTPINILKNLSESSFYEYRVAVALNPSTPSEIIEGLLKDKEVLSSQAMKKDQL